MNDKYWEEEIETIPREKLRELQLQRLKKDNQYCCKFSLL